MSETNKIYRNAGLYSFGDGFNILNSAPIDSRTFVNNITDIYDDANWSEIGVKPYPGLIVSSPSGDVKIYVGPVISKLSDVTDSEEQIGWRKKENWLDVNIPKINPSDAGRLLTIVPVQTGTDEETGDPIYKYEAQWADAPSGLPTINGTSDANKILQVNAGGNGVAWVKAPEELPTINGASDANKVLQVNASGTGVAWAKAPEELPTYTTVESGKVLTVSSDGTSTEWSTIDTELVKTVTNVQLYQLVTRGQLKPGMKYRITDYAPAVNTRYNVTINSAHHYASASAAGAVKFDIIVTASSPNTLFEDVELVAKEGVTTVFDYTKYEVKYDFIGNINELKYDYIQSGAGGVIYYMKDQFGNEASYDFENIFYIGLTPGMSLYTFSGWESGDLRQYGIIQNVRIKYPRNILPGIIFDFPLYQNNNSAQIIDVELNNCTGIYTKSTNLRHAKISNSHTVNIKMEYDDTIMSIPYPMFENLNICNNDDLHITDVARTILLFGEGYGGFYVNNLNILPSLIYKEISLVDIAAQMTSIFKQGLIDSDVLNKMGITPDSGTGNWLLAVMDQEETEDASRVLFAQQWPTILDKKCDLLVYDAINNASKNVRPFNIFNAVDDNSGYYINWNLEIPHFQSTATSVYELGI